VVTTGTGRYSRQIGAEEQQIYDHLLHWIEFETPSQMIERFQMLFVDGVNYPDAAVANSLHKVVSSRLAEEEFRYVLNRCCHILINRWQARPQSQAAIPQLVQVFETATAIAAASPARSRTTQRLRELIKLFQQTEQYLTLQRLSQVCQWLKPQKILEVVHWVR